MSAGATQFWSERQSRAFLGRALVFSLLAHLLVLGGWWTAKKFGWLDATLPRWLQKFSLSQLPLVPKIAPAKLEELRKKQEERERQVQLNFLDVDPASATPEPPKNPKYYAAMNSKAANPEIKVESDQPNIDGRQQQVAKTKDVPKTSPQPLQPTPPAPKPPEEAQQAEKKSEPQEAAQPKPKGGKQIGDLALAKPVEQPRPETGKTESKAGEAEAPTQARPRTIAEAKARLQESGGLAGEKTFQPGGVRNLRLEAGLDAIGTKFGEYDAMIIAAIQQCWYDNIGTRLTPKGRVVVEFRLLYTGAVQDVHIVENDTGDFFGALCQLAIQKPAPFQPFPRDMRRMLDTDYREVRFAFYYD